MGDGHDGGRDANGGGLNGLHPGKSGGKSGNDGKRRDLGMRKRTERCGNATAPFVQRVAGIAHRDDQEPGEHAENEEHRLAQA